MIQQNYFQIYYTSDRVHGTVGRECRLNKRCLPLNDTSRHKYHFVLLGIK